MNNFTDRIRAISDGVEYPVIADIGCDHAYISICAVLSGRAEYAYACDINPGPLKRAEDNIKKFGLTNKITVKLGSGLEPLSGTGVETIIIAGLGGYLTVSILSDGVKYMRGVKQLILQPMRETAGVRRHIHAMDFMIKNENLIYEDGTFYAILDCRPGCEPVYSAAEYEYGRARIQKSPEVFFRYIQSETDKITGIIKNIDSGAHTANPKTSDRRGELVKMLGILREAHA